MSGRDTASISDKRLDASREPRGKRATRAVDASTLGRPDDSSNLTKDLWSALFGSYNVGTTGAGMAGSGPSSDAASGGPGSSSSGAGGSSGGGGGGDGGSGALVELAGDFAGMDGTTVAGAALLGAIAELGDTTLFVKMTGPREAVHAERARFLELCSSLREAEGP